MWRPSLPAAPENEVDKSKRVNQNQKVASRKNQNSESKGTKTLHRAKRTCGDGI